VLGCFQQRTSKLATFCPHTLKPASINTSILLVVVELWFEGTWMLLRRHFKTSRLKTTHLKTKLDQCYHGAGFKVVLFLEVLRWDSWGFEGGCGCRIPVLLGELSVWLHICRAWKILEPASGPFFVKSGPTSVKLGPA
jgi:hypothetical protein